MTTAAPPLGVAGPGADASADLTAGRRRLVLAAMCLALVLVVAGVSMLNVALPSMTFASAYKLIDRCFGLMGSLKGKTASHGGGCAKSDLDA